MLQDYLICLLQMYWYLQLLDLRNESTNLWHTGDVAIIETSPIQSFIYVGTDATAGPTTNDDWHALNDTVTQLTNAEVLTALNGNDGTTDINDNLLSSNFVRLNTGGTFTGDVVIPNLDVTNQIDTAFGVRHLSDGGSSDY